MTNVQQSGINWPKLRQVKPHYNYSVTTQRVVWLLRSILPCCVTR